VVVINVWIGGVAFNVAALWNIRDNLLTHYQQSV